MKLNYSQFVESIGRRGRCVTKKYNLCPINNSPETRFGLGIMQLNRYDSLEAMAKWAYNSVMESNLKVYFNQCGGSIDSGDIRHILNNRFRLKPAVNENGLLVESKNDHLDWALVVWNKLPTYYYGDEKPDFGAGFYSVLIHKYIVLLHMARKIGPAEEYMVASYLLKDIMEYGFSHHSDQIDAFAALRLIRDDYGFDIQPDIVQNKLKKLGNRSDLLVQGMNDDNNDKANLVYTKYQALLQSYLSYDETTTFESCFEWMKSHGYRMYTTKNVLQYKLQNLPLGVDLDTDASLLSFYGSGQSAT